MLLLLLVWLLPLPKWLFDEELLVELLDELLLLLVVLPIAKKPASDDFNTLRIFVRFFLHVLPLACCLKLDSNCPADFDDFQKTWLQAHLSWTSFLFVALLCYITTAGHVLVLL